MKSVPAILVVDDDHAFRGVIAAELTAIVYVSFSQRKRIGTKAWRRLHWLTYAVFALATAHGVGAGTDSARPWASLLYGGAAGAVIAAAAWRALMPPGRAGEREAKRPRARTAPDPAEVAPAAR